MGHRHVIALLASLSLGGGLLAAAPGLAAAAAPPARALLQSTSPVAASSAPLSATPASAPVDFSVGLQLADPAGALALEQAVSDPASAGYRQYLTPAQWEKRFSPAQSSVAAVTSWLRSAGITVESVTPDRMTIQASGSAAAVEQAFATGLREYRHLGRTVRLASGPLTVPSSIASLITGVTGVDQNVSTPAALTGAEPPAAPSQAAKKPPKEIPQPEGFRNAPPCSPSYGKKLDATDPAYGGGYPNPLPYAVCGYTPPQLQGAYGLTSQIKGGITGKGVTVAIVDAYVSPTLLADAQQYSQRHQPGEVITGGQFSELLSTSFNHAGLCEASGWYGEQTLDVEAVHATAPGANVLYVGAKNCLGGLFSSVQQVVDGHLAQIVTNSWGDNGGDLLDSPGTRHSFDNVLLMAAGTGVGVQFSAGDEGDEFANLGATVADYPPSSPYATAVGGTSLQVSAGRARLAELGWSTSKSALCTLTLLELKYPGCTTGLVSTWVPAAPGRYLYGGGGGTSFQYPEPFYQEGVVPAALAERNSSTTGIRNRVEPDISMDADPTTGMLVGETQTFPNGVYYDEYRIGGTSLSSPLFAGEMALADQAAGTALGFVNPLLYRLAGSSSAARAFYDVVPAGNQANVRVDYHNGFDATEGLITSVRTFAYAGPEEFCSVGGCTQQQVALSTASGFDSMTGIGSPGRGLVAALAKP
jgi:subtilase family serine protease